MDEVIAVDIAIEPDDTMMRRAKSDNGRLLKNFPQGYALDDTHHAHITMLQRFVRTSELEKVYAAVAGAVAGENPSSWKLKAVRYYYIPGGAIGLAGIVVDVTDDMLRVQQRLIDAVAPLSVAKGTKAAFFTTPAEPDINPGVIDYVAAFVPEHSGKNFLPHVTIGAGTTAYLKAMIAEPFEAFTFSPAGASVYQLGDYGTARKNLKTLEFNG